MAPGIGIPIMKKFQFKIIMKGLTDSSQARRGRDIFYFCEICGDYISSQPKDNINCKCRNIAIDVDYVRLYVNDFAKFTVVERMT